MAEDTKSIVLKSTTGLRNNVPSHRFSNTDLELAVNVDVDNLGALSRRPGRTLKYAGDVRSLWASDMVTLFAEGTLLKRLNRDYTASVLVSGIDSINSISYAQADFLTFWTDGLHTGVVTEGQSRSAGLAVPIFQPVSAVIAGDLYPGIYQYALTFVRGDGQESGAGIAERITLTDTGGISFTSIPVSTDPTVLRKRLYVTSHNGEVLLLVHEMYNNVTTYNLQSKNRYSLLELSTQFLVPPPPGSLLGYYKGHLYVVVGRVVFYSKAFSYELFDLREYFILPNEITIFAPSEDGIFVTTKAETFYLDGDTPTEMKLQKVDGTGGVKGTLSYVPGSVLREVLKLFYLSGNVPVWTSVTGINYGLPKGQLMNPIVDKFTLQEGSNGASIYDNSSGINRYITSMTT